MSYKSTMKEVCLESRLERMNTVCLPDVCNESKSQMTNVTDNEMYTILLIE